MPGEAQFTAGQLLGFLLVFTRIASIFTFVPLPGARAGLQLPRIVVSMAITVGLYGRWPAMDIASWGLTDIIPLVIAEAVFGITIGAAVAVLAESFLLGAQLISIQAGFSYGSMIDPVTQSESTVLLVLAQLFAGLLFFAFGLDREVLKAVIVSIQNVPPGTFHITAQMVERWTSLTGWMFATGLRIALPVIVLLVAVDVVFGVISRINAHMQVLGLLLSGKILITLAVLGTVVGLFPVIYSGVAGKVMDAVHFATRTP